jgi:hypothetical protein
MEPLGQITISPTLLNERGVEMVAQLTKIFNRAKQDQRSELFTSFAVIATHLVRADKSISECLKAVGLEAISADLAPFLAENKLLDEARTALKVMEILDNTNPDSWGSFMEFCRNQFS